MTEEEIFKRLQEIAENSSVEDLIGMLYHASQKEFESVQVKRGLIRAMGLQLTLKIMRDSYVEAGE